MKPPVRRQHKPNSRHSPTERLAIDRMLQRVDERMQALGMSRSQLADELGRSRGNISGWWTQGYSPDASALIALPAILKCNGHWLMTGEGSPIAGGTDRDAEASYAIGGADALTRLEQLLRLMRERWTTGQAVTGEDAADDQQMVARILQFPHARKPASRKAR